MSKFLKYVVQILVIFIMVLGYSCTKGKKLQPVKDAIVNCDFEMAGEKLTGWNLEARHAPYLLKPATGEPVANISEDAHSGKQSLHVFWDIPETDNWGSLWTLTNETLYPVKPGEVFTVTAWMKGSSGFRCGKVWMEVIGLADNKIVEVGIGKDMMNAKSYWMSFEAKTVVPEGCNQMQVRFTGGHRTDLFLDDVQVYSGHPKPHESIQKPLVTGLATKRVIEKLNRGIVAVPVENIEVYIGWRLLETDIESTAFNVYRVSGSSSIVRLNEKPIISTTDFTDKNPVMNESSTYFVRSIVNGVEGNPSENANVSLPTETDSYISIKLDGDYSANKAGVGDLDGDGQFEYVIKTPNISFDPWAGDGRERRGLWQPSPETYKLEAYHLDGTLMWQYDMGWSIEMGTWFSPYIVYDFDGDGCAEVALKAGEGDPRQPGGQVRSGPEYLLILDGKTGKEIARTDWIPREGYVTDEACNRNQLCVAYLDGKTPYIIVERGTYDIIALAAYALENGQLRQVWTWSDGEEDWLTYTGQGAHCIHGVDVDDDGRDEVVIGGAVIDDNGVGLWTNHEMLTPRGGMYGYNSGSGHGHPDRCVVGELDPNHPGLEVYLCIEPGMEKNGVCQLDAKTGELLWGIDEESEHCHYGLIADIDPNEPGVEIWGGDQGLDNYWLLSAEGKLLSRDKNITRHAAFWDADLQREYFDLDKKSLVDHPGAHESSMELPEKPLMIADVFGDWREELIIAVNGELRIYTTSIPATDRRITLLRDPIYRLDVSQQSQGYASLPAFKVNPN